LTTKTLHIGLDDTDSTKGGCTTYLTAVLIEKLRLYGVNFLDYPLLVRLNPNVPWKTRGNGALCLRFSYPSEVEVQIKKTAMALWEEHSAVDQRGTDPGIVFFDGEEIPADLTAFSKKAETTVVKLKEAMALIKKYHAQAQGHNTCRGIIGALAAVGETLNCDHTYELIAYRRPENLASKRRMDEASIFEMDKKTQPYTYNNVDYENGRVIITPRGPDPILFGIRGESAEVVKRAYSIVKPQEPVERWVVFRSNQGTDAHLRRIQNLSQIEPYQSITVRGVVSQKPHIVPLRHVIFQIKDAQREIDCAAYEPTGVLRKIAMELEVGDEIEVTGAVKKATTNRPLTINLEKIQVQSLAQKTLIENPMCPGCGKRLKSMGRNQGYRCQKCGCKFPKLKKIEVAQQRGLTLGLYFTSARSQRHLTKPERRYGQEKTCSVLNGLVTQWYFP
jgi:tRNA(Ile2)-agmatinylcytidine synthase